MQESSPTGSTLQAVKLTTPSNGANVKTPRRGLNIAKPIKPGCPYRPTCKWSGDGQDTCRACNHRYKNKETTWKLCYECDCKFCFNGEKDPLCVGWAGELKFKVGQKWKCKECGAKSSGCQAPPIKDKEEKDN